MWAGNFLQFGLRLRVAITNALAAVLCALAILCETGIVSTARAQTVAPARPADGAEALPAQTPAAEPAADKSPVAELAQLLQSASTSRRCSKK